MNYLGGIYPQKDISRSLYVAEDVKAGDVVTEKNVRSVRPGYGLHPKYLPEVLGKKFVKDYTCGERFALELIDKSFRLLRQVVK